jgi:tetratricopeptide (TPR) repeat protein
MPGQRFGIGQPLFPPFGYAEAPEPMPGWMAGPLALPYPYEPYPQSDKFLAIRVRQQQVTELMKLYHLCCKHGLYDEAAKIALRTCEIDPKNVAALAAVRVAHLLANQMKAGTVQHEHPGICPSDFHTAPMVPAAKPREEGAEKQKVKQLLEQFHTYYKEGKYAEAQMCAMKILELEPNNGEAATGFHLAHTQQRLEMFKDISKQKQTDLHSLCEPDAPDQNLPHNCSKTAKTAQIQRRLASPISLKFKDAELDQIIDDLRDISGINIVPDIAALEEAGICLHTKLTFNADNVSMATALTLLLRPLHLTYVIKDEVLQITTQAAAHQAEVPAGSCPAKPCTRHEGSKTAPCCADLEQAVIGGIAADVLMKLVAGSMAQCPCSGLGGVMGAACLPCVQLLEVVLELSYAPPEVPHEKQLREKSEAIIEDILTSPAGTAAAPEVSDQRLYQVANLLYEQQLYYQASYYLKDLVEEYPGSPYQLPAQERLAQCYTRLADQSIDLLQGRSGSGAEDRTTERTQGKSYAKMAMTTYAQLEKDLEPRLKAGTLSDDEKAILRRASFALVDGCFDQGDYVEAMRRSQKLAKRYARRVECLTAYQNIFRCGVLLQQTAEARRALQHAFDALHTTLKALPDEAFSKAAGTAMTRPEWNAWINNRAALLPSKKS